MGQGRHGSGETWVREGIGKKSHRSDKAWVTGGKDKERRDFWISVGHSSRG